MAEWWENGTQLWCQVRTSGLELQSLQESKVEHARHRDWRISHPLIWCEPLNHYLLCPSNSSSERERERERGRELSTLSGFPMASRVIYSSSTAPSSSTPISSHTKLPKVSNFMQNANTLQPSSVFGKAMTISNSRVSLHSNPINKRTSGLVRCSASSSALPAALLFGCDGVLVDTERDGHRVSFNDAFTEVLSNPSNFFF